MKIQYNRNRYYDYYTGRWLTQDPLGITLNSQYFNRFEPLARYDDTLNLYEYVRSNPVDSLDPFGTMTVSCCKERLPKWLKDPKVKKYYTWAKKKKDFWGSCLKKIKCKKSCGKNVLGKYHLFWREITLCAKYLCADKEAKMTLVHELVHAISLCGKGTKGCKGCMIEEKRAYYLAFQCFSNWECTQRSWGSCTYGKKPKCDKKKDHWLSYLGVGWPPDPSVVF